MGWSYGRFRGWTRFFILGSIVVSLLLTQSWTALVFLMVIFGSWALIAVSKRPSLAVLISCTCLLLAMFVVRRTSPSLGMLFEEMLNAKYGSTEGHSLSWGAWGSKWTEWAKHGDSTYNS